MDGSKNPWTVWELLPRHRNNVAALTPKNLHDAVVTTIARTTRGYAVYTNTGKSRAVCIAAGPGEIFPDVILCDPESLIMRHVIEVETESSVAIPDRVPRWARIARMCGSFWLLVPPHTLLTAVRLCLNARITAQIGTWTADQAGIVSITWPRRVPTGFVVTNAPHPRLPARAEVITS